MKKDSEILNELIKKGLIYKKQKIYYSSIQRENAHDITSTEPTFLELYSEYKDIRSITAFAKILGIAPSVICARRKTTSSERIVINVFNKEMLSDDERLECINFVRDKYSLGLSHNQRCSGIYYSEVQMYNAQDTSYKGPFLHTMYKELLMKFKLKCSEQEFAVLLGIKGFIAFSCQTYKYKATLNIPVSELTKEQKEKLLEYLIQHYSLYKGQKIYYSRKYAKRQDYKGPFIDEMFQELPESIKTRIKIEDIINLLGIRCFNQTRSMRILDNRVLNREEQDRYFNYLVDTYELTYQYSKKGVFFSETQKNNSVDYNYDGPYLLDMYEQSPLDFKSKCTIYEMIQLLQTTKSFKNSTYSTSKDKIVILINQELTDEENEYINKLANDLERTHIKYQVGEHSFKSLYEKYKLKLTEKEFAERFGISPYILMTMKMNPEYSAVIINMNKMTKAINVMRNITESRFYSIKELTALCLSNEIAVEDFITYMDTSGKKSSSLYNVLQKKRKLFIPKCSDNAGKFVMHKTHIPMNTDMYESIYDTLEFKIKKSVFSLIKQCKTDIDKEDLVQIGLEAVLSSCGELQKNFYEEGKFDTKDDEEAFWCFTIGRVKKLLKYTILSEKRLSTNLQNNISHFKTVNHDDYCFEDDVIHFEDKELIDWEKDDDETKALKLKNIISMYAKSREYNTSEIVQAIQDRFGISVQNMSMLLSILQNNMINSGFAKSSSSGEIILGKGEEK